MSRISKDSDRPRPTPVPVLNRPLSWFTLVLGYLGFIAVMVGQAYANLWLLSLITGGVLLPLVFFSYGPKLDQLLKFHGKAIIFGVLGAVVLSLISYVSTEFLAETWVAFAPAMDECYQNLNAWPGKYWALPVIFLLVLVEELIWRGLLFDLLSEKMSGVILIAVATVLFPIPHVLTGNLVLGLAAFGLGFVCNLLRYRLDSLLAPLIAHFGWNLMIMIFFPIQINF